MPGPPRRPHASPRPVSDADLAALQGLLDAVPMPLEPLDPSALDGFLCGVIVQPRRVPESALWPRVIDVDGRRPPAAIAMAPLRELVRRRHDELHDAIVHRRWFDPWVFALDEAGGDGDAVAEAGRPWATGFAVALETFPELLGSDDPETTEPLALVYRHLGADHLDDAEALLEAIEALEPPADLGTAVEELVRATLLLADAAGLPHERR